MIREYGVSRNVKAVNKDGTPMMENGKQVLLAMVMIKHENGFEEPLMIREDEIKWAGEGIIDIRVNARARK